MRASRLGSNGLIFLALVTAVPAFGPQLVPAEKPPQRVVRVGFVGPASAYGDPRGISVFKERLRQLGYVEGRNLVIDSHWADGEYNSRNRFSSPSGRAGEPSLAFHA